MECLEFKRLALSDPNSKDPSFVEHADTCPSCFKYIGDVREMDANLVDSLKVELPSNLMAKLELNQVLERDKEVATYFKQYSKVAGFALLMFASGFMLKGMLPSDGASDSHISHAEPTGSHLDLSQSSEGMVVKVIDHLELEPTAPIWNSSQANQTMKTLMASYDPDLKLKDMDQLLFIKICPVDYEYRALHANLATEHGQVTFAYIKGHAIGEVSDTSYKGYVTRIKPIRNGSLVIVSQNMYAMEEADTKLESAIYWDI